MASASAQGQSRERRSSLTQTRARYQQIIQDLTGDARQHAPNDSFSDGQPQSVSETDPALRRETFGESQIDPDETPENVREYVKKFKEEVEVKFAESDANRNFRINPGRDCVDPEESLQSMANVTRYDLAAQNILRRFGSQERSFDASLAADLLIEIGKLDRTSLKTQLANEKSGVLSALLGNLSDKFLTTAGRKRRLMIDDSLAEKKDAKFMKAKYSSSHAIGILNGNSDLELQNQLSREVKAKRDLEGASYDNTYGGAKLHKKSSRQEKQEKDSLKNSVHKDLKLNIQSDVHMQSKANMHQNIGMLTSKETEREGYRKSKGDKGYNLNVMQGYHVPTSPKTTSRQGNPNRKVRNSISGRQKVAVTTARAHMLSPSKQLSSLQLNQGVTRRSDLTLFTNKMLTSTLSPKSNVSSNTAKSNSRQRARKVMPLKVVTKKSIPRGSTTSSQQLNLCSSQLLSKIKKSGDDTSKATQTSSGNVKQKIITRITSGAGYSHKKKEREQLVSPTYSYKQNSARVMVTSRSKEPSNDCSKKKRRLETESTAHSSIPGLQQVVCIQPTGHHSGIQSLSKNHWKRRLENMI